MRRGMTLLEVLVAGIVLAVGVVGSLEAIARCAANSREVRDRSRALMFARSKLEEILKEPVVQVGNEQGQGDETSTEYDWQVDIEPSSNDSLVMVTVLVKNHVTNFTTTLTALRRPDLSTTDTSGTTTGTDGSAGTAAGGTL